MNKAKFQSSLDVSLGTRHAGWVDSSVLPHVSIVLGRLSWYSRLHGLGGGEVGHVSIVLGRLSWYSR